MKKYEINKYPPSLFKKGRFLRNDWIACTDIGSATSRGVLNKEEYLRVEGLYVAAVVALAHTVEPSSLQAHDVESWETESDTLVKLGLEDVFDGSAPPVEGEPVTGARLENIVRRCLREVAWLELMIEPRLLIHFGWDMRLIVALTFPLPSSFDEIRSAGLFVYDSDAPLPTLDAWAHR